MKHTNLFVTVGRAEPKPVCTVDEKNPDHDFLIEQATRQTFAQLVAGGNDSARISFHEETVDVPEQSEAKAVSKKRSK